MELPAFDMEGHRGARGLLPENTIPSMLLALDLGVTTLELDVLITKDEQVILSHDPQLNPAYEFLPAGEAVAAANNTYTWYDLNYSDIRKFDVGSRYYEEFPEQQKLQVHKPLLSEVIDAVQAHVKERKRKPVLFNIELKSEPETDGKFHPRPEVFAQLVMDVVHEKQVQEQVIIQSFDVRIMQAVHPKYPHIKTALLVENSDSFETNLQRLGYSPVSYNPWYKLVTPALVADCHQRGMKLITWTVNTLEEMRHLKQMGVDGIISDYPNLFRQL
ncbi:glycerophosphodiester phosphodiesterase family protein [Botryobacter ruber]|uniref:glycerophosphodiester phosphodiesterase family protein n=1 Tax=Botryobacter ruber TaxID=2171629 RepID=UPI001F0CBFD2|nr:glycerophosphodiester phosphodiesterase family protein [Botryobacter ruber]